MTDLLPGEGASPAAAAGEDLARSVAEAIDCANPSPDEALRDGIVDDAALAALRNRCCRAGWKNDGVVATYAEPGPGGAQDHVILGYAPFDPALGDSFCVGGSTGSGVSKGPVGVALAGGGDARESGSSLATPVSSGVPGVGTVSEAPGGGGGGGIPGGGNPGGGTLGGGGGKPVGGTPVVGAPSGPDGPARVPEIDAVSGLVVVAALAAVMAFRRERR